MVRAFISFFIGGILGTAFGIAVGFFIFPYVFPPAPANEALMVDAGESSVATGTFIHANPNDPVHYGSGTVEVFESAVFLNSDFNVGAGPDFHVYLVPKEGIRQSSEVKDTMFVDLGKLRAFSGSQQYSIPDGVDLANYPSVVIWCQQFGVLISPADLAFKA